MGRRIVTLGTRARVASDYSALLKAVQESGLLQRRRGYYFVKIAVLLGALAGCWLLFGLLGENWSQIGIAAGLGVLFAQVLFLSHDAAHRQMFQSSRANEWTALLLGTGCGGVSLTWWNAKHSRHHASPNQVGKDPDIDAALVHFYPAENPPRSALGLALHRHQGWWFGPLLIVEALNLHQQSVVSLLTNKDSKRRGIESTLLLLRVAVVPTLALVFLPVGMAFLFVAVQWAVTGVYLGVVFSVSHIGMPVVAPEARIDFLRRQMLTSRNVRGGRAASMLMGGLNYQIEHHLFPSMPRPNLRKARDIVRAFAHQQDIDYHEVPIYTAWAIVVRYLNQVGLAGRKSYSCPTFAVLR